MTLMTESIVPQNIMLALKNINSRAAQEAENEEEDYIDDSGCFGGWGGG
jgi:hypothetical protein